MEVKDIKFKRKLFGGVDETDVYRTLLELQKEHEAEKLMIIAHYKAIFKKEHVSN